MAVDDAETIRGGRGVWAATPWNYSSARFMMLNADSTGRLIYCYGQTIYAKIDVRFELPTPGRIRFEYMETPQLQRRPTFQPTEANRLKEIDFTLTEPETVFREDVTGFVFRFSWILEFAEPPYPDGLSFPSPVPKVFYGYREQIGDRFTPLP